MHHQFVKVDTYLYTFLSMIERHPNTHSYIQEFSASVKSVEVESEAVNVTFTFTINFTFTR